MRVAKYEIRDGTECESFFKQKPAKQKENKRETAENQAENAGFGSPHNFHISVSVEKTFCRFAAVTHRAHKFVRKFLPAVSRAMHAGSNSAQISIVVGDDIRLGNSARPKIIRIASRCGQTPGATQSLSIF